MYLYLKALHIIFVVTWFAGLFYIVRLFIYNREAEDHGVEERKILHQQFNVMIRRLWLGITWPSCILTVILGTWILILYGNFPIWLLIKTGLVLGLVMYHFSLHIIYKQQQAQIFKYSSAQLRLWNEAATVFLFSIVFLVVLKNTLSFLWGMAWFAGLVILLLLGFYVYKRYRENSK